MLNIQLNRNALRPVALTAAIGLLGGIAVLGSFHNNANEAKTIETRDVLGNPISYEIGEVVDIGSQTIMVRARSKVEVYDKNPELSKAQDLARKVLPHVVSEPETHDANVEATTQITFDNCKSAHVNVLSGDIEILVGATQPQAYHKKKVTSMEFISNGNELVRCHQGLINTPEFDYPLGIRKHPEHYTISVQN